MRYKIIVLILLILNASVNYSQNKANNYLKLKLEHPNLNENLHVIVKGNISELRKNSSLLGVNIKYSIGDIASVYAPLSSIVQLLNKNYIKSIEYNQPHNQLMNDTMLVRNRIKAVKQGQTPLAQAYDGTGVIVGIIDSGCDFAHPDFKNSNGTTRIQFLWDQVATGTNVPQPYNYGVEWTAAQINASVCTHNDLAHFGHGTHVTGIAAGNGNATGTFEGIANKADIVVVALDFNLNGPTIADAVNYIFSKATLLGKPCVINASVGDYYGSHDATDMEAQLIENMVKNTPGRALVAAAGNAGNIKFHTKTSLTNTDTVFTWLKKSGSFMQYWLYADTNQIKNVQLSVGANRPNFFDLGRIPFQTYNYALGSLKNDTLKYNGKRIGFIKTTASINSFGVYELYYQIFADSLNYNWRIESKGNGLHHAWNFDFVSSGLPTVVQYPKITKYVMPDTISTIVTGFQCSNEVIAVGNYINKNTWLDVNNTLQVSASETPGKIKETSSSGPTRNNMIKPDVTATGANVFSAMALGMQNNLITNLPSAVAQGSFHVQGGGTSAASPVVAGLAALYLQAYPNATNQQIKSAIINCTYSDGFTGSLLPNNLYGYGKLDGKAAILCSVATGLLNSNFINNGAVYPNPFKDKLYIRLNEAERGTVNIYDVIGHLLYTESINSSEINIDKSKINHYNGLLLVSVISNGNINTFKIISE